MRNRGSMWAILAILVVLVLLATAAGTGAAPVAQEPQGYEPSAIACGDLAFCSTGGNSLEVQNSGTGPAIYGRNTSSVYGAGVYGRSSKGAGVRAQSTSGNGIYASSYNVAGVRGKSTWGAGVKAESANGRGVDASGPTGVYGKSNANYGEGVHGHGTGSNTEGLLGTSAESVGVYGISSGTTGNNIGVWGQTAGTWGFFSGQSIQVSGCTGCTFSFIAVNDDVRALEAGEMVAIGGIAPPLQGQQTPILKVKQASAGSGALGVVQSRAEVNPTKARTTGGEFAKTETMEIAGLTQGVAAPGDYLLVVVQGLIQVRANAATGIQAGDQLTADGGGQAIQATSEAQIIGRAVDVVDPTTGLVWVLVDLQ